MTGIYENMRLLILASIFLYAQAWIPTADVTKTTKKLQTCQLQMAKQRDPETMLRRKKIIEESTPPDKYHLTTNSKKELIFDQKSGRFFETSIRPGSLHQLWGEFLNREDPPTETATTSSSFSSEMVPTTSSSFSSEMVPTTSLAKTSSKKYEIDVDTNPEECLIHTPYQDTCEVPIDTSFDLSTETNEVFPAPTIVEACYKAWNSRNMKGVVSCFSNAFEYQDSQYLGKMTTKQELEQHFSRQADLLPPSSLLVLDHIAHDEENGNIATQWHIERRDGSIVPYTKGVSFYTTKNGQITSGFRVSEMLVKPNRNPINGIMSIRPSFHQQGILTAGSKSSTSNRKDGRERRGVSIIEQYFEAWNQRDMELALSCFIEDCLYQIEDPLFVDTFAGKSALREHLEKNANVLPSSCKILLDKIALDQKSGNIGTCWHLEIYGIPIPNLKGCSIYTTDPETGLLKTGFDVTEQPVKLPRDVMPFLWPPAVAIFDL
jgi:ketosteroid isomerase-like protein